MYGQIAGSSTRSANASQADEWRQSVDSQSFAETVADVPPDPYAASRSAATRLYSLVSRSPIEEIDKDSFRTKAQAFHGDEIKHIAANPQEYSDFVSKKAKRTVQLADKYGTTRDSERARYFSYQLGTRSAGLLRTEGGFSMTDFEGEKWRELFPGRTDITSVVDLQVTHPLVENAGDILLEHQLRLDGKKPLLVWRPANEDARARAAKLGFVEVDKDNMVLDPTQHSDIWIKNSAGEWQRAHKHPLYLSKAAASESNEATESASAASPATYSYEDDFM